MASDLVSASRPSLLGHSRMRLGLRVGERCSGAEERVGVGADRDGVQSG